MSQPVFLSVITVTRDNLERLRRTVVSVLSQKDISFEYLIIDGKSGDGTVEYLKTIDDSRVMTISEPDVGIYDAMNKGARLARGERVLFINAGDTFAAEDALHRLLEKPSAADVVYGDVNLVWPDRKVRFNGLETPTVDGLLSTSLPHPASAIRRDTLLKYGGYDTTLKIVSDWKFWLELLRKGGSFEHRTVLVADFVKDGVSTMQTELCTYERERVKRELFGMVKLSVVIPVYNVEPYIRECLDSVLAQPVALEVICVDDCSLDRSAAICEEYAAAHPNVRVVRNKANSFAGTCRNQGMDLAVGEYIAFVDSDDRVEKGIYRKLIDVADREKLEVIRGAARVFDAETGAFIDDPYWRQDRFRGPAKRGEVVDYKNVIEDLVGVACVPFTGICRRDLLTRFNIRYNSLRCSNDISFFIEMMLKASRVKFIPDSIVQYRVNNKKSLVGVRTKYYGDVLSCGREIMDRIAPYNQTIRRQVLDFVFNAYPHWLNTALDQSEPAKREEIKAAYRQFFGELDKRPWNGRMMERYWAKALREILGAESFHEERPIDLSVVIPVYNTAPYVKDCLDSVLKAVKKSAQWNIEIVVIDDGSTDDSLAVLTDYRKEHENSFAKFTLLHQENKGLGATRNRGLSICEGDYVYFLDADDEIESDLLATTLPLLKKNGLDLIMFSAEPFADGAGFEARIAGHRRYYAIDPKACRKVFDGPSLARALAETNQVPVSAPLRIYDRRFLIRNKLFFPEKQLHEDYAIGYIALFSATRAMAVPNKFYRRREIGTSITGRTDWDETRAEGQLKNALALIDFVTSRRFSDRQLVNAIAVAAMEMVKLERASGKDDPRRELIGYLAAAAKNVDAKPSATPIAPLPMSASACDRELSRAVREVAELKASVAYCVGMLITWPARKLWRAFRDHPRVDSWFVRHGR